MAKYVVMAIGNATRAEVAGGARLLAWLVDAIDGQTAATTAAAQGDDGRYAVSPVGGLDVYSVQSSRVRNATLEP